MRHATLAALVLSASFLVPASCRKDDGPKPRKAFEAWLASVEKCDTAAMRAGLTKASIDQVEQLIRQLQAFVPEDRRPKFDLLGELCKGYRKGAIQVQDEIVAADGKSATVKLLSDGKPLDAPMMIEDGTWRLDFTALMKQTISAATANRIGKPSESEPAAPVAPAAPEAAPAAPSPAPATAP